MEKPIEKLPHIYELDGQWPSDTWFRRAMARKLKRDAEELLKEALDELSKVQS